MINAKEAARKVEKKLKKGMKRDERYVIKEVKKAIRRGDDSVTVDWISDELENQFIKKGYKIEPVSMFCFFGNEIKYKISWKEGDA